MFSLIASRSNHPMTLNLVCLVIAVLSTSVALVLTTRRAKLSTPVKALFGLNLLAIVVAIVLTALAPA